MTTAIVDPPTQPVDLHSVIAALGRIEEQLAELRSKQTIKDFYSTDEVARRLGKAEFTCREWCRLGRIHATKRFSGRGKHPSWAISHTELLRIEKEGLLPLIPFNR